MGNLSTKIIYQLLFKETLPCYSRSFSPLLMWEETWVKATKPLTTMSIYKSPKLIP